MKLRILLIFLVVAHIPGKAALSDESKAAVKAIIARSAVPLPDLVESIRGTTLPSLPPPGTYSDDDQILLSALRDLIWRRLINFDALQQVSSKGANADIKSITALRNWLLQQPGYSNLVLAVYAEETSMVCVMRSLAKGDISPQTAKEFRAPFVNRPLELPGLFEAVMSSGGASKSLQAAVAKRSQGQRSDLIAVSLAMGIELGDDEPFKPTNLLSKTRPASLTYYAGWVTALCHVADGCIELSNRGVSLTNDYDALRTSFQEKAPELFLKRYDAFTGTEMSPTVFAAGYREIVEWKQGRYSDQGL